MWGGNSGFEKEPENLYGVNIMFFFKSSVDEFKSRLDIAEAKISTLKVRTEEIFHIKFWDLKMVKYESENIKCKIWRSCGGESEKM